MYSVLCFPFRFFPYSPVDLIHSSPHRLAYVLIFGAISGDILRSLFTGSSIDVVVDTTWGVSKCRPLKWMLQTNLDHSLSPSPPFPHSLPPTSHPLLPPSLIPSPLPPSLSSISSQLYLLSSYFSLVPSSTSLYLPLLILPYPSWATPLVSPTQPTCKF